MLYYAVRYVQRKIVSAFGATLLEESLHRRYGRNYVEQQKGRLHYATTNQKDLWDRDLVIIYFDGNANMEKFYWRRRHDKGKKISKFRRRLTFCFLW